MKETTKRAKSKAITLKTPTPEELLERLAEVGFSKDGTYSVENILSALSTGLSYLERLERLKRHNSDELQRYIQTSKRQASKWVELALTGEETETVKTVHPDGSKTTTTITRHKPDVRGAIMAQSHYLELLGWLPNL